MIMSVLFFYLPNNPKDTQRRQETDQFKQSNKSDLSQL